MDGDVLFDRDGVQSSHSSEILKDKFRDVSKATVEDDNQNNSMSMRSYGKEQDESSDAMISDDDEGEEADDSEEEVDVVEKVANALEAETKDADEDEEEADEEG